jgi:hypothetical protein
VNPLLSRAQRSVNDALQTRDRYERRRRYGPGSAVHRYALHRVRDTQFRRRSQTRMAPALLAQYNKLAYNKHAY